MDCKNEELQLYPRSWHSGDTLPVLAGVFDYDITGYVIEGEFTRPDDTVVTKTAALSVPYIFVFNWDDTDLIEGTTILNIKVHNGPNVETIGPIGIKVLP